jgi:hypothetical protein
VKTSKNLFERPQDRKIDHFRTLTGSKRKGSSGTRIFVFTHDIANQVPDWRTEGILRKD